MNKKIAAFVFAIGMGVSYSALATNCFYYCNLAKNNCLKYAGTDADAQAACWDTYMTCTDGC